MAKLMRDNCNHSAGRNLTVLSSTINHQPINDYETLHNSRSSGFNKAAHGQNVTCVHTQPGQHLSFSIKDDWIESTIYNTNEIFKAFHIVRKVTSVNPAHTSSRYGGPGI